MTLSDQYFVIGGVAAWGVAMSAIGVLWQRNIKLGGRGRSIAITARCRHGRPGDAALVSGSRLPFC